MSLQRRRIRFDIGRTDVTEKSRATELHISSRDGGAATSITLSGDIADLHEDPAKIHQLLDLLNLPKGTEVKVDRRTVRNVGIDGNLPFKASANIDTLVSMIALTIPKSV